jgi:hypothetical protein
MRQNDTQYRYFLIRPQDIAYLKFILEAYDGVGILRTLDSKAAVVEIMVAPDYSRVLDDILADLRRETDIEEIDPAPFLGKDTFCK